MPTRIAGVQPGFLPWLGFFDQALKVDAFVLADELTFTTSGWTHRNRVKGPAGEHWLTLPARAERGQAINEVALDTGYPWAKKQLKSLRNFYARGRDAKSTLDALEPVIDSKATRMVDVSIGTIRFLAERLGVKTPILVSSELGLEARYAERFPELPGPTHRIISYMEALGATVLLEGASGRSYFDVELFRQHGMTVEFHDYKHPEYPQLHGPFLPFLSALDLLLCAGDEEAKRVLLAAVQG